MTLRAITITITMNLLSHGVLAVEFFEKVTGNYQLERVTQASGKSLKNNNCPKALNIEFNKEKSILKLKDRDDGELFEVFTSINKKKSITKLDFMTRQETSTTLNKRVLTVRSRLCRGIINRNCQGKNFKPKMSLLSSEQDLVFNIYGNDHRLQAKCHYQRPNEIGL